jgi:hypothetical protein
MIGNKSELIANYELALPRYWGKEDFLEGLCSDRLSDSIISRIRKSFSCSEFEYLTLRQFIMSKIAVRKTAR